MLRVLTIGVLVFLLFCALSMLFFYAIPEIFTTKNTGIISAVSPADAVTSSAVKSLAPSYDFYTELPLSKDSVKAAARPTVVQHDSSVALQLAVFKDKKNAHLFSDRLALLGYSSLIVVEKSKFKTLYKVLIGPYATVGDTEKDQRKLALIKIKSFPVSYSPKSST